MQRGDDIDGTLDQAVQTCGSKDSFIRDGLGITDGELDALRA